MKHLDKFLMVLLIVGVWALVLKPTNITAHTGMNRIIECSISGTAYGEAMNNQAQIFNWGHVSVDCE